MTRPSANNYAIASAIAGLLILAVAWSAMSTAHEPHYKGKGLSYWFNFYIRPVAPMGNAEAADAIKKMGTNAAPYLAQQLRYGSPGKISRMYWRFYTGFAPKWRLRLPPAELPGIRRMAALALLTQMGADARPAVPEMLRLIGCEYQSEHNLPITGKVDWLNLFNHPQLNLATNGPKAPSMGMMFRQELTQAVMTAGGDNPNIYPMILASVQEYEMTQGRSGVNTPFIENTNLVPTAMVSEKLLFQASTNALPRIRVISVAGLGLLAGDDPDVTHLLMRAVSDPLMELRYRALQRLAGYPSMDLKTALTLALEIKGDTNEAIINSKIKLLHEAGGVGRKYIENLKSMMLETNATLRKGAVVALRDAPAKAVRLLAKDRIEELADPMKEKDEEVRNEAAETLTRIGLQ
jgi:hypothetical protein